MRRMLAFTLIGMMLLSAVGCARDEQGQEPQATQAAAADTASEGSGTDHVEPATAAPPDPVKPAGPDEQAQHIQNALLSWGDPNQVETGAEWVGLDDQGRLVVGGRITAEVFNELPKARTWFKDPRVDRVYIREHWRGPITSRTTGTYSILSRERFDSWPRPSGEGTPFQPDQWPQNVDIYGVFASDRGYHAWAEQEALVRKWVTERFGSRLVQLKDRPEGETLVTVVVNSTGESEQDRIKEAATLLAGLQVLNLTQVAQVEYQGVEKARVIRVADNPLTDWVNYNRDESHLADCVSVDGREFREKCYANRPSTSALKNLTSVLAARPVLRGLLPKADKLVIGRAYAARYPVVMIHSEVPISQSWEQAWATYDVILDQIFTQTPGLFEVQLILQRGDEMEFILMSRNQWAMRHFMVSTAGVKVDPSTLKLTADYYQRYRIGR